MTARPLVGLNARERLRRLSFVFSVELRMKIVIELYMREMSARQFYEEFGGGSLSRVSQTFTRLTEEGWLRHIHSEGPGGARRGGIEHFFRATELPFIDSESWSLVPFSVRAISTWNFLKMVFPRLREDVATAGRDSAYRRELSCATFLLDEEGWERATSAVSSQFARLFEEQEDARRRVVHTGEELFRADVFLIAFESLLPGNTAQATPSDHLVEWHREPVVPFPQRLAPVLKDDLRLAIVSESNRREVSVRQLDREFSEASGQALKQRFKALETHAWLARAKALSGGMRRGATEQFFLATRPAVGDYDPGTGSLGQLAGTEAWREFESLSEHAKDAIAAGTFDARTNRCLSWSLIRLDRQGWENVTAGIEALPPLISKEQRRARRQSPKSGGKTIPLTLGLAAFEAPPESNRVP